ALVACGASNKPIKIEDETVRLCGHPRIDATSFSAIAFAETEARAKRRTSWVEVPDDVQEALCADDCGADTPVGIELGGGGLFTRYHRPTRVMLDVGRHRIAQSRARSRKPHRA